MEIAQEKKTSWLDRSLVSAISINWETLLFTALIFIAIFTRFYDLEARVMSHDENSHVYYSWLFYQGQGYSHDPITHGPLQFHLVALSYFLFGDNDLTARIPAVLFSIATVAFLWPWRRYLGRAGALVAALLMIISPYILFYGRYVRNEAFVAFFGVVTLWAILRFIETGGKSYLLILTAVTSLHFTTKETAFIYTAQAMLFLGFYLIYRLTTRPWINGDDRKRFLILLLVALLLVGAAFGFLLLQPDAPPGAGATAEGVVPAEGEEAAPALQSLPGVLWLFIAAALAVAAAAIFFLVRGYSWERLRTERAFGVLIVLTTLVLPMLAPFPVRALGVNPIDYNNPTSMTYTIAFVVVLSLLGVAVGLLWNWRDWLLNAAVFYVIFTVLYTSLFTNGLGFLTGLVGSLGYWLEQQGVNRGNQPLYYYALVQVPIYEFLPALGSLLALVLAVMGKRAARVTGAEQPALVVSESDENLPADDMVSGDELPAWITADDPPGAQPDVIQPPVLSLLGFWAISSLLAYTVAGEKMPWLTVHITLPMILLSGWSLGWLIEATDWRFVHRRRGALILLLIPLFTLSLAAALGALLGTAAPFQGSTIEELRVTTQFVVSLVVAVLAGLGLFFLLREWEGGQFYRLLILFGFALLGMVTARTAFRAAYVNYDNAKELLVYAHSAGGVKEALAQIEELSRRTSGELSMPVAYDDQTTYPYWWYLRDYADKRSYGANPTRSLRDVPAILVGDSNYGKIEPVVGQNYYQFDYVRLWWPIQDYFDLTWERIANAFTDADMRAALWDIWFNRDYTQYAAVTGKDLSLPNWYPSARMRLYLRKDLVAQLWDYGAAPVAAAELEADPYEERRIELAPAAVIGSPGVAPGQFQRPRGVSVAADGTLYVADTGNHRIQHLTPEGEVLQVWGSFADSAAGEAPGGAFNEPWGLDVGPDGSVYVADTWNHRIQKFTPTGEFVTAWGFFGQAESPYAIWGPRDVAVDEQGRVFITDTGNKRVVVYDADGGFLFEIGQAGMGLGEFDEPVGIAVGPDGRVYVADTWNQRVQALTETSANEFAAETAFDVAAWYGQSLDNKPYIAAGGEPPFVYITDPEGYRVLQFTPEGELAQLWGDYSVGLDGFGLAGGIAVDEQNGVWISDAGNGRLLYFAPPAPAPPSDVEAPAEVGDEAPAEAGDEAPAEQPGEPAP